MLTATRLLNPTFFCLASTSRQQALKPFFSTTSVVCAKKPKKINYVFEPLDPADLVEKNVHGSGPGGSKVNKSFNAVFLKHVPTGLHVKVHEHRLIDWNRRLALEKLTELVDEHTNGENSYLAQIRRAEAEYREQLRLEKEEKKAKLELKKYYDAVWEKQQVKSGCDDDETIMQNDAPTMNETDKPVITSTARTISSRSS